VNGAPPRSGAAALLRGGARLRPYHRADLLLPQRSRPISPDSSRAVRREFMFAQAITASSASDWLTYPHQSPSSDAGTVSESHREHSDRTISVHVQQEGARCNSHQERKSNYINIITGFTEPRRLRTPSENIDQSSFTRPNRQVPATRPIASSTHTCIQCHAANATFHTERLEGRIGLDTAAAPGKDKKKNKTKAVRASRSIATRATSAVRRSHDASARGSLSVMRVCTR